MPNRPTDSLYFSVNHPPALATLNDEDTIAYLARLNLPSSLAAESPSLELLSKLVGPTRASSTGQDRMLTWHPDSFWHINSASLTTLLRCMSTTQIGTASQRRSSWGRGLGCSSAGTTFGELCIKVGEASVSRSTALHRPCYGVRPDLTVAIAQSSMLTNSINRVRVPGQRSRNACLHVRVLWQCWPRSQIIDERRPSSRRHRGKNPAEEGYLWSAVTHELMIVDWEGSDQRWVFDVGFGGGGCPKPYVV